MMEKAISLAIEKIVDLTIFLEEWVKEKFHIIKKITKLLYETISSVISMIFMICMILVIYYNLLNITDVIIAIIIIHVLKSLIKKTYMFNFYKNMPIPKERMTYISDDRKIVKTVNRDAAYNMIIYVNELENYLESKGLL